MKLCHYRFFFDKYYSFSKYLPYFKRNYLTTSRNMSTKSQYSVYVTRRIPHEAIAMLDSFCSVKMWDKDEPVPRDVLLKNVSEVDALYCILTDKIDKELIGQCGEKLKVISTMSVGFDHLDLASCKERNIMVGYTPDVLTDATAELTVSLILAVSRRLVEGVSAVKSGEWGTWSPLWMCGKSLLNSTVGIVGLGRIGIAVARRLQPFGVHQFLYSGHNEKSWASEVNAKFVSLDELLKCSDFVVVTCALNSETEGMFNKQVFSKMKKSAIFVNTSRGGLVNQDDLYDALKTGRIAAAGLDVTAPEPLPTTHKLLTLSNCVILPHIGSATVNTRTNMAVLCAQNIIAGLSGQSMPAQLRL